LFLLFNRAVQNGKVQPFYFSWPTDETFFVNILATTVGHHWFET